MEEPQTMYDFKELFVEFCVRELNSDIFTPIVSPNNLVAMSMLDSSTLEGFEKGAPLYSGPDLFTSLRHQISGFRREQWISGNLRPILQDENDRNELGRLMDEDLKDAGHLNMIGAAASLMNKAREIAKYRIRKDLSLMQQPSRSMEIGENNTFKVTLKCFVGGQGGSTKESILYFDYSTSFPLFQIILRDATQLSTIPPIDLDQKASTKKEIGPDAGSDTSSQTSSIPYRQRIQQRSSDRGSESSYQSRSSIYSPILGSQGSLNPQAKPKRRNANARGYTIDDGPWLYRLSCNGLPLSEAYLEIKDEDSYLKMIDIIKGAPRRDVRKECGVTLFHSVDKIASDKWDRLQREEKNAEEHFQKACRNGEISNVSVNIDDDQDEVDEDDIGEPYLQWLKKDLAFQNTSMNCSGR